MAAEELGSPATAPPPKRRKIEPPRRNKPSQVAPDKNKLAAPLFSSSVPGALPARVDLHKVSEAKRFAVLQAQHEGCLASYKSFDSHFGNYLVPVIPSNDFFEQIGKKQ